MKCFICGKSEKSLDWHSWNYFADDNICDECADDFDLYQSYKNGEMKKQTNRNYLKSDLLISLSDFNRMMTKFRGV